jgi:hypothetical protein
VFLVLGLLVIVALLRIFTAGRSTEGRPQELSVVESFRYPS